MACPERRGKRSRTKAARTWGESRGLPRERRRLMRKTTGPDGTTMTRREFLVRSALATIPLVVSSAQAGQAPAPSAQSIRRGGTLVASTPWTYPTMDPHISTMGTDMLGCGAMFNGLVRLQLVDAKTWEHALVGDLAESWE